MRLSFKIYHNSGAATFFAIVSGILRCFFVIYGVLLLLGRTENHTSSAVVIGIILLIAAIILILFSESVGDKIEERAILKKAKRNLEFALKMYIQYPRLQKKLREVNPNVGPAFYAYMSQFKAYRQ